jgi:monothiol bacilliredoxin
MPEAPDDAGAVTGLTASSGRDWLAQLAAGARTLLYKHSPVCGTSRRAELEVRRWAAGHPDITVVQLDVVRQKSLSRELAQALGIAHESPQAILLEGSRVVWHGSHGQVHRDELEQAVGLFGVGG